MAQASLIATRTLAQFQKLVEQYNTILRMSQRLGGMDRYRTPSIATSRHDTTRYPYGAPLLTALNEGDPDASLYLRASHPLRSTAGVSSLPANTRRVVESDLSTIEVADSISTRAVQQVGRGRSSALSMASAIAALMDDVLNGNDDFHTMTVILGKLAAAENIGRHQDEVGNQLMSTVVEQHIARAKRTRDTDVAVMNMAIVGRTHGRAAGRALVAGSAEALQSWRQP